MSLEILDEFEKELRGKVGSERAIEIIRRTKNFNKELSDVFDYYSISIEDIRQSTIKKKPRVILDVDNGSFNYKVDLLIDRLIFYKNKEEILYRGIIGKGKAYLQDGKIEDITGREFTAWSIKSIKVNK